MIDTIGDGDFMKIGTSTYSFWKYIKNGEMTETDAIKIAAKMGYEAIECIDLTSREDMDELQYAAHLKEVAEENGITIPAYAVGGNLALKNKQELQKEKERLKKCVDVAAMLGAKYMRHDVMSDYNCFSSFEDALPTLADAAREIAEYAKSRGVMTLLENHGRICQDPDRIERLISAVNHSNYGLLLDVGNFMCADLDPVYCVARLAHLAKYVHLKDAKIIPFGTQCELYRTRGCNYLDFVVIGSGDADVRRSVAVLQAAGFDGYMDIEYEGSQDCIKALEESVEEIKKILS